MRLIIIFLILCQGVIFPDLDNLYKDKRIQLKKAHAIGFADNGEPVFFDKYKSMAIDKSGHIFVSNSRQHTIYKFFPDGKYLKFGVKGEGPGDLCFPQKLSVLDNKYLVVGEYALKRKISLFTLEGKIYKVLKTKHNCARMG